MSHPADRGHILTEMRNDRTMALDTLSVAECVRAINEADQRVAFAVAAAAPAITALIEDIEPRFLRGGRLIYIGAGTSGRLGVLDASECPPTFQTEPERVVGIIAGGDSALRRSSESMEDDPDGAHEELERLAIGPDDSLIGIAAGGTTPYVRGAIEFAHANDALTGLITCTTIEPPEGTDHLVCINTGPEVVTGSTRMKAGTATKMVLNTISTTLMVRSGKVYENLMVDLRATNDKLRDRAARIVMELTHLTREQAFELLARANGLVKHAVVMHRLGISFDEADRRLNAAGGWLRRALEQ